MEQGTGKERYTPMGQEAESKDSHVDMEKIYRQLDAEDKVIEYLAGEIAKERKKPGFLQDQARIDKCLDTIAKLKNHKTEYSQEELKAKANALLAKARAKEAAAPAPIRRYRLRPVLVAVILLVVVCLCGATACGVIPSLRMWFAKLVNNPGASVEDNGITYSYNGQAVIYKDVYELCSSEKLNILIPQKLPENICLKNVQRKIENDVETVFFVYNVSSFSVFVTINYQGVFEVDSTYTEHRINNQAIAYYWKDSGLNRYMAILLHNDNYYSISAVDESSLLYILDNLGGI